MGPRTLFDGSCGPVACRLDRGHHALVIRESHSLVFVHVECERLETDVVAAPEVDPIEALALARVGDGDRAERLRDVREPGVPESFRVVRVGRALRVEIEVARNEDRSGPAVDRLQQDVRVTRPVARPALRLARLEVGVDHRE